MSHLIDEELKDIEEAYKQRLPELKAPDVGNYPLQKKLHIALATPEEMSMLHKVCNLVSNRSFVAATL